jgi:DHA2 family multidrug resistance protein
MRKHLLSHYFFKPGAGMVMSPIVMFIVSAVPVQMGQSAASVGVFVRFSTFSLSLSLINYCQLYFKGGHSNDMGKRLSLLDFGLAERLQIYQSTLSGHGMLKDQAAKVATGLLNKAVQKQAFLQFCIDYYEMIAILCLVTIVLIALQPVISRTIINVRGSILHLQDFKCFSAAILALMNGGRSAVMKGFF